MVHKITDIMGVTSSESVELATYHLQDIAHTWFKQWNGDKGAKAGPIKWKDLLMPS